MEGRGGIGVEGCELKGREWKERGGDGRGGNRRRRGREGVIGRGWSGKREWDGRGDVGVE